MALKRRPLKRRKQPKYPRSTAYDSDRRGFLMIMGAAAVAVSGIMILKNDTETVRRIKINESNRPTTNVAGATKGVSPVSKVPQTENCCTPLPPEPSALTTSQNQCKLRTAGPQAAAEGDLATPILPRRRTAATRRMPAPVPDKTQTIIQEERVAPRAKAMGKVAGPSMVKQPIPKPPKTPPVEDDF